MRIRIGTIEIEASNREDFEWLLNQQLPKLRGGATASANDEAPITLVSGKRFRRTKDELARGLSPEQAMAERAQNGGNPLVESDEDRGLKFDGEVDLTKIPE
jgi:hypothetical protein